MDMLKTKTVFWKRENGAAGARRIKPCNEYHADAARWHTQAVEEVRR